MITYSVLEQKCLNQACAILDKLPENANHRLADVLAVSKLLELAREARRPEAKEMVPPRYHIP